MTGPSVTFFYRLSPGGVEQERKLNNSGGPELDHGTCKVLSISTVSGAEKAVVRTSRISGRAPDPL